MATIINRDGRWQAKIRRTGFPLKTKTFAAKAEAERWARQVEAAMDAGSWNDRSTADRLTVGEAVERWESTILSKLAQSTQASDMVRCGIIKNDPISKLRLGRLAALDILDLIDRCDEAGRSNQTTFQYVMIISRVVTSARELWGMPFLTNPVTQLPRERKAYLRRPAREARRLVDDEEERLLAASSPQMGRVIRFALATAMRRSEIADLRWRDVHENQRFIIALDTKNGENRHVPLSRVALGLLAEIDRPEDLKNGVFGMSASAITQAMADACSRANIDNLRFHDLRHEAISRMSHAGNLTTSRLAAISGHKTLQMLRRYDHATMAELADALDQKTI